MRFVLLWASIPPVSFLLASTGLFELRIRSPGSTPPGSQGAAQCSLSSGQGPRVTLLMAANRARVCIFPSFWPLVLASACGLRSPIWPHLAAALLPTQPRPALPYAAGSNASGFAAAAFSAPLASSMLAVPLARPGMAPATGSAPPTSCASTPVDSISSASVFMAAPASPRVSGSSWSSLRARPQAHMHGVNLTMRTRAEVVIGLISSNVCDRTSSKSHKHFEQAFVNGHREEYKIGQHVSSPRSDGAGKHTTRKTQQPDTSDPQFFKTRAIIHTPNFHHGKLFAHSLNHTPLTLLANASRTDT